MKSIKITPLKFPVKAEVIIPGSKSYTNRALLIAALTDNPVKIVNPLISDDTNAMIDCLRTLGIQINQQKDVIEVVGSIKDIKNGNYDLNADLSATALRFILPVLSLVPGTKVLKGKTGLNNRPIKELVDSLISLGANIEYIERDNFPPLKIVQSDLISKNITLNGQTSSQYLSSLLMILPLIGKLRIDIDSKQISKPYIDITIDIMKNFGVSVLNNNYKSYSIRPNQRYSATKYKVEGDFSSASYFFAIAALTKSNLVLKNLNPNSVQADKRFLEILEKMGNKIIYSENDITIQGTGIASVNIGMIDFPDQAQTLAVLAAFANGKTFLKGLQSLRIKETDRIKAVENGLNKMKIKTKSTHDTLEIFGGNPVGATIDTYNDHRVAMSFAVAGSILTAMEINDPDVVAKTFPDFWSKLEQIGIQLERIEN